MSTFHAILSSILTTFSWLNKGTRPLNAPSHPDQAQSNDKVLRLCAVCLSSMEGEGEGDEITGTRTLPCLHEFHRACVDKWLGMPSARNTCPICRFSMGEGCSNGDKGSKRQECFTEEMVIWFSSFHVAGF